MTEYGPGRRLVAALTTGLAIALFSLASVADDRADLVQATLAALEDGGEVIYLRHADTTGMPLDSLYRLGQREGQRNLSEAGRRQAVAIGEAIEALPIPVGRILAGPVFRARDTAGLAFGADNVTITQDLLADDYAAGRLHEAMAATRALIAAVPDEGNTVLVGHRTPLEIVTGDRYPDSILPEGGMAVFTPHGDGGFTYVGNIKPDELVAAAERR